MRPSAIVYWFYELINNYNLFVPDENDYEDDDERRDPTDVLKQQKYATWFYVIVLSTSLYVLFVAVLLSPQSRTGTVSSPNQKLFEELYLAHGETLSCPCSTITIPYSIFVQNMISYHPICSSVFVSQKWIEALYHPQASTFTIEDFRKTAKSQFELLSALCSVSSKAVSHVLSNIDNDQFIGTHILQEENVRSQVMATIGLIKSTAAIQVTSLLDFIQAIFPSNTIVSALATNSFTSVFRPIDRSYADIEHTFYQNPNPLTVRDLLLINCAHRGSATPAGFIPILFYQTNTYLRTWPVDQLANGLARDSIMVDGFYGGCTPLDALLFSTLDCLYNLTCLQILPKYFPALNQTSLQWVQPLSSSNQQKKRLNETLANLFVNNWTTLIDYGNYFLRCAPSFCTYLITDESNFSQSLSLLLRLYGGLTAICRLFAPLLINIAMKFKRRSYSISLRKSTQWLKRLNMFKSVVNRNEVDLKQQRIMTWIFFALLIVSTVIFVLRNCLEMNDVIMVVHNPSLLDYQDLQENYLTTLKCSCSKTAITYNQFVFISPRFHQICASTFVKESWISVFMISYPIFERSTWLHGAYKYFGLLASICNLANKTVDDSVRKFLARTMISPQVLLKKDFDTQLDSSITQFIQSIVIKFNLLMDTMRIFIQIDQPFTISEPKLITFENNNEIVLYFKDMNMSTPSITCRCATSTWCQLPTVLHTERASRKRDVSTRIARWIPYVFPADGLVQGCFTIDSLLLSTLECFYPSVCYSELIQYVDDTISSSLSARNQWKESRPLISHGIPTRFDTKTLFSSIVKEMLIEEWNKSFSFNLYYDKCAPHSCSYSIRERQNSSIEILIRLISAIGGLVLLLKLIIPPLIQFIFRFLQPKSNNVQRIRQKAFDRFKSSVQHLLKFLSNKIINLNIFPARTFSTHLDRLTVKRLGQWTTRLHIFLVIFIVIILSLYTIIQARVVTEVILHPSFDTYNDLIQNHSDTLQCPCLVISSAYRHLVQINATLHQVCSSEFVSIRWRMNLTSHLFTNLFRYDKKDYRRFLAAHLQFLTGLCQLSFQSFNASSQQSLSSILITKELLRKDRFENHINAMIEDTKSNAREMLNQTLFLFRSINSGNAIISTYGTNFQYNYTMYSSQHAYTYTYPMIYENNCTCGLTQTCTIPANFILPENPSRLVPIKGLHMGCLPTESFLVSTLECFYDLSCIQLIQNVTNNLISWNYLPALSETLTRFTMNMTVMELIEELFIEEWLIETNYLLYFNQCSPVQCSYTYIQHVDPIYTITYLLGVYAGLSLLLKWICPRLISILYNLYQRRKKQMTRVQPISTVETDLSESPLRMLSKSSIIHLLVVALLVLITVATLIMVPSVHLVQKKNSHSSQIKASSSVRDEMIDVITTTKVPSKKTLCSPTFYPISFYPTHPLIAPNSVNIGDFNNDNHMDIAILIIIGGLSTVDVMFGNSNGTFQSPITTETNFTTSYVDWFYTCDANNDNRIDLIVVHSHIDVFFGNGDGTFHAARILSLRTFDKIKQIIVNNINNDDRLSFLIWNHQTYSVNLLIIDIEGGLQEITIVSNVSASYNIWITGTDLNRDGRLDIICINRSSMGSVLLGNEHGTYQNREYFSITIDAEPGSIVANDLNKDDLLDIIILNKNIFNVDILLANDDGTFQERRTFPSEPYSASGWIAIGDLNQDSWPDIIIDSVNRGSLSLLLNTHDGTFTRPIRIPLVESGSIKFLAILELNADHQLDIFYFNSDTRTINILYNSCQCCMLNELNQTSFKDE